MDFVFFTFILYLKTYWHILKVPKVSISKTFLIPFVERAYAVAKKLPAAPLTKISTCPNYFTVYSTTR
jgi:hypothetical protein